MKNSVLVFVPISSQKQLLHLTGETEYILSQYTSTGFRDILLLQFENS